MCVFIFLRLRFKSNTREVDCHHTQVITSIQNFITVIIMPHTKETATTHRRYRNARTSDATVIRCTNDIWVHTFRSAFQSQLFDVIVAILWIKVNAFFHEHNEFREHRSNAFFTQTTDTVFQNSFLDHPFIITRTRTKSNRNEWGLSVSSMQGVHFIFV
ncbi:hypothetical protein KKP3664_000079 [Citrobacter phage KKP_3664]|nr:hypothetical protein KKP3664_000079 [Citrobacter phage KKP_3664]